MMNTQQVEKIKSKSDWFEVYKINDQTFGIVEPNHAEKVISYLIMGKERAVLFDTGMGIADIRSEVASLTSLPIVVVNSHSHYDHIGGNHQFHDIWSFENAFENNRIERGYSHDECVKYMNDGSYVHLPKGFDLSKFMVPGSCITKYLTHEEKIDLGERILTVHSTPGETPGAITLSDDLFNILFVGDLMYSGTIWMHLKESSWSQFVSSVNYIDSLSNNAGLICPGHNDVCLQTDFVRRVKQSTGWIDEKVVSGVMEQDNIVYKFEGFSILTNNLK
ncbi:MAG: MBL fold metallo-hydrolase [Vallitaleaceae bacterium]|nr:MBL fold metallo-hydrolase [Vallitaleaceae bacterium]